MAEHEHDDDHEHESHGSVKQFLYVFGWLLALTLASFGVGNSPIMSATPVIGWALMMAISCAKAMLVISFFMHLLWEANWKYVLTIPASIMSVFLVLMLVPDVGMRGENYSEERDRHAAKPRVAHAADPTGESGGKANEASPSH